MWILYFRHEMHRKSRIIQIAPDKHVHKSCAIQIPIGKHSTGLADNTNQEYICPGTDLDHGIGNRDLILHNYFSSSQSFPCARSKRSYIVTGCFTYSSTIRDYMPYHASTCHGGQKYRRRLLLIRYFSHHDITSCSLIHLYIVFWHIPLCSCTLHERQPSANILSMLLRSSFSCRFPFFYFPFL